MLRFKVSQMFMILIFLSFPLIAQSIEFCESVDKDGYAVSPSDVFTISSNGGYLKVLVRLPSRVNSSYVKYVIYKIVDGDEKYDNTIKQEVEDNWVFFWKEITFYESGTFRIYVFNDNDVQLVSGSVRINFE